MDISNWIVWKIVNQHKQTRFIFTPEYSLFWQSEVEDTLKENEKIESWNFLKLYFFDHSVMGLGVKVIK